LSAQAIGLKNLSRLALAWPPSFLDAGLATLQIRKFPLESSIKKRADPSIGDLRQEKPRRPHETPRQLLRFS
jgi:hypothetical protein